MIIAGDSDAKVLTLAEHIIAAMPERIKVRAPSFGNTQKTKFICLISE